MLPNVPISLDIERQGAGFGGDPAAFLPGVALRLEGVKLCAKSIQDVIVVSAVKRERKIKDAMRQKHWEYCSIWHKH